ncbi:3-hydroxymyristoyl/3-hydroxydecanoyl-(Acyl carrier protein) dehydratase [Frankia canadensis]|uniref:3-hydroxymyristoyl/3-hydroxydecanoyl-(Acyl carrier protein) dehydratase n=1 Tax=Frankia canadensis TaxID=1836972 RepID=A0A2I2KJ37_9ACTN|nr:beta-ketoacyl synthase [Frankia canadensis]SNQ45675.1 3-hydroxymyristoyl/3-hydroxydecanoyl-(Acyl carrier protein) dehydratase [Frankia canadensis]SOU52965.1 3-hydroxymyristoyl/3-hydroxydecanoyl-(Acyl carrier protein) dehydratase [Frankia canadensis]
MTVVAQETVAGRGVPGQEFSVDEAEELGFAGEAFDPLALAAPTVPAAPAVPAVPAGVTASPAAEVGAPVFDPDAVVVAPVGSRELVARGAVGAVRVGDPAAASVTEMIRLLRATTVAAHASALRAQTGLQRRALARLGLSAGVDAGPPAHAAGLALAGTPALPVALPPAPARGRVTTEASFKPLARTTVRALGPAELDRIARAEIAAVFGAAYEQEGLDGAVRFTGAGPSLLAAVEAIELRGGRAGRGLLRARLVAPPGAALGEADVVAAAAQAARLFAVYLGLHLCLPDARFVEGAAASGEAADGAGPRVALAGAEGGEFVLVVEIADVDLVPRPWLRADAELRRVGPGAGGATANGVGGTANGRPGAAPGVAGGAGESDGEVLARVVDLVVGLREPDGRAVGPEIGGRPAAWLGRRNRFGDRAMLSEFHMAHFCRGDQAIALGPEFAGYTGRKATRLPSGGLLLVDRVLELHGTRGEAATLAGGASHVTEYDAPADSWYFADTANASMPNCVYMETSLQAALMVGYYMGATLGDPAAVVSLRNLGGSATVLREIDLRDATIRQHSRLLSTTDMPGSSLQNFSYTLSVDGEPFYEGETLFGYFSDGALANQTGLDAGKFAPTWLDSVDPRPATRTIDVAARRADPHARLIARDHLALLDTVDVVDGGGRYGEGYLHAVRAIDPDDWFFARHFHLDPVIPGSLGVETVIQAMQEWLLDSAHADGLVDPAFILPVGTAFTWKYRGQFLPTDGETRLEVHIKEVRRGQGRVRVTGDASVWKPGLRIYECLGIAVELREDGAPSW